MIVLVVLNVLASLLIFAGAKSAIHEILATVTFLVASVLLGTLAVIGAVGQSRRDILEELRAVRCSQDTQPSATK